MTTDSVASLKQIRNAMLFVLSRRNDGCLPRTLRTLVAQRLNSLEVITMDWRRVVGSEANCNRIVRKNGIIYLGMEPRDLMVSLAESQEVRMLQYAVLKTLRILGGAGTSEEVRRRIGTSAAYDTDLWNEARNNLIAAGVIDQPSPRHKMYIPA